LLVEKFNLSASAASRTGHLLGYIAATYSKLAYKRCNARRKKRRRDHVRRHRQWRRSRYLDPPAALSVSRSWTPGLRRASWIHAVGSRSVVNHVESSVNHVQRATCAN